MLKGPGRSRSQFITTGPQHNASAAGAPAQCKIPPESAIAHSVNRALSPVKGAKTFCYGLNCRAMQVIDDLIKKNKKNLNVVVNLHISNSFFAPTSFILCHDSVVNAAGLAEWECLCLNFRRHLIACRGCRRSRRGRGCTRQHRVQPRQHKPVRARRQRREVRTRSCCTDGCVPFLSHFASSDSRPRIFFSLSLSPSATTSQHHNCLELRQQ